MSDVKVGQVWADNDWRSAGRTIEVEEVTATHAICKVLTKVDSPAYGPPNGRRTRIRLDRFRPTSTGYRLMSDPGEVREG